MRRRGLGSALLEWNIARSRERAATLDPAAPVAVQAHVEEGEVGHAALVVARGFEIVRRFQLMRRDLTEPVADVPLPDGLELRHVLPEQHRAIYEAQGEAFRDHWGAREPTDHGFEYTYGRKELDTGLWVVAWDGDEIAGVIENWIWAEENDTLGVQRGWLERVSVRRPWRRRGLARAMSAASLVRLRDAGMTEAMLGVDADNSNGAVALYEGVGFEVHRTELAYPAGCSRHSAATFRASATQRASEDRYGRPSWLSEACRPDSMPILASGQADARVPGESNALDRPRRSAGAHSVASPSDSPHCR